MPSYKQETIAMYASSICMCSLMQLYYLYSGQLCVLWIDAHADLNTGATSASGNMHGMSVGMVLKELAHNTLINNFPPSWWDYN